MWLKLVPVALGLAAVCIANYTDLKERIIPDNMTYPLIVFGIVFYLAYGIYDGNLFEAFYGIIGASLAFGIGYVMYLTGGWAGGDVKLFTALGALLPVYEVPFDFPYPTAFPPYAVNLPLFPLTLLFNSVIAVVPFLLVYVGIMRLRGKGAFYEMEKISNLEEGMIPAETIYEKDGEIKRYRAGKLGFLSRSLSSPDWDRKITNPDRAAGVSEEEAEELRNIVQEGKLEDKIKLKKGMPFAPAYGAGVFIGIFYGGLYWTFIEMLV